MRENDWKFCAGGIVEPLIHKEIWIDTFFRCLNPLKLPRNYLVDVKGNKSAEFIFTSDIPQLFGISKKFMKKNFWQSFLDNSFEARREFLGLSNEVQKINLHILSNDKIALIFQRYLDVFKKIALYFWATQAEFMQYPELVFRKKIKHTLKIDLKVEEAISLLTRPIDLTIIEKEQMDFIKLVRKTKVPTKKELENHAFNYPWLLFHEFDRERGISFLKKKLKLSNTNKINFFLDKKRIAQRQKELLNKIKDPKIDYLSSFFKRMALERFELKASWAGAAFLFSPVFQEIANRLNTNKKTLIWQLRSKEILSSLKTGQLNISSRKISNRFNSYLIWLDNNQIKFYDGEKSSDIERKLLGGGAFENFSVNRLEGKVACTGKVNGYVKVIRDYDIMSLLKDSNKFKEGWIIVITMIQPNMAPLVKKAKAIITEEGGIISHAAILAREFNIPCVVGTGNATHVLSDGDFVEVDAENGVVRKIDKRY